MRWRCGKRVATNDYSDNALRNHAVVTSAVSSISPRTAASIVICDERRGWGKEGVRRRRHNGAGPRVRDTRECVFSLVTVTCDALARCIGRYSRPYEAFSVRKKYMHDSGARLRFDISRKEREVCANKCTCAGKTR